jgi:iron complex transport system ATP-binding protein
VSTLVACGVTVRVDRATLLRDVSLELRPREWLAVIGPNGAGKSTLLRAIAALGRFEGTIEIGGERVDALRPRERARRIALVPQVPVIPTGITVTDYVLLGRNPHISLLGSETTRDLDVVRDVMALLDLQSFAARRVETLSGGERQRVLLARALAQEASLLLLDEPTSALDIGHQQDVLELVDHLRIARGLTVITTMHDLTLAGRYADSLLLLAGGEAAVSGTRDVVLTERNLARYYGAAVRILEDEHGLVVVPHRTTREVGK